MFRESKVDEVTPQQASDLRDSGAVLVDVREHDEWDAGHAAGAVHVPLGDVPGALARFDGQEVLTVCRSGGRSSKAAAVLAKAGVQVHNVAGGMSTWSAAGLPVVRDDGSPGVVI